MSDRLSGIRKAMERSGVDGLLLYSGENRRYFSGFTGSTGYLVISAGAAAFITDFRYKEQAALQCRGYEIIIHGNSLMESLADIISRYGIKKLGIEEDFMTVNLYEDAARLFTGTQLIRAKKLIDSVRAEKDAEEVENIRQAARIADRAFSHLLDYIRPGRTEYEVALELEFFCRRNGAGSMSFDSIVASGARSALPHGTATEKQIHEGEFLTLDFGCVYNGYCSDMTRTVFIGKAEEKHREIYGIVLKAQQEVIKRIKPGMKGRDVDSIARDIITESGYGEYFGHGLGHGVGLAIHEEPRLSTVSESVLKPGMIVTDEPGIYIPDFGGVRIEDLLLITGNGCEVLSKSPKELIEL